MKRTRIYGMMAEFDSVHTLVDAANARAKPATKRSTPTARFRSKDWPRRSASITMKFRWWC